jgi:hypothetical protein
MGKVKPGDVFEINTKIGKCYLQYCLLNANGVELIRVLAGVYKTQPSNISEIVGAPERYVVHFPVAAAFRKKLIALIDNFPLPPGFSKPHLMRATYLSQGKFLGWHIIDTKTLQRRYVKELSVAERFLSPWGIWNDTFLKERLVEGWSLENWDI